ncbi:CDGSH iron-sulfur domain-containing protein 2 homolog [Zerene cesonia]|uniref:CDGSH iron-sulfur domain-containing protein 2 homolog n=1 Tax=Zerene cesonia TaxID=33412 RepID=UPI0018E593AC|nr:CDGSH iron-sulfur domain-containing protein 2 homolog [Zerene cesonia]
MNSVSVLIKESIPNYLTGLPIPESFDGWFRLSFRDWLALLPPTLAIGGLSYVSYQTVKKARQGNGMMNHSIQKDQRIVVDFIDIEDISDKAPLCRCWKSKKFPYCDGYHYAHNIMTGDNTGPVLVGYREELK